MAGSLKASSSSIAIWNPRISAAASSARSIKACMSSKAPAIAAFNAAISPAGVPDLRLTVWGLAKCISGPAKMPPDAGLPLTSTAGGILSGLVEIALDQGDERLDRSASVRPLRPDMEKGVLLGLQRHHLDDRLGIDPRTFSGARNLDLRGKALGKLGQLDRRPGVQPHI